MKSLELEPYGEGFWVVTGGKASVKFAIQAEKFSILKDDGSGKLVKFAEGDSLYECFGFCQDVAKSQQLTSK